MKGLMYGLKAKNSSGDQFLFCDYDEGMDEFYLNLLGKYRDKDIQIDFNPLSEDDIKYLIKFLEVSLKVKQDFKNEN